MAGMSKKVSGIAKPQLPAGEAGPATVGKDLGPLGPNLMEFCRRYDPATQDRRGFVVPVVSAVPVVPAVPVFEDRSFEPAIKMPTTASLIRRAVGLDLGGYRSDPWRLGAGVHIPWEGFSPKRIAPVFEPALQSWARDRTRVRADVLAGEGVCHGDARGAADGASPTSPVAGGARRDTP